MTNRPPVLVIGHIDTPSLEVVEKAAAVDGTTLRVVRPHLGEQLPPLSEVRGVIALGGPQSAYHESEHPHLVTERNYIAEAHAVDTPTLAICLGSQLAAVALGGSAHTGESGLEVGFIDVTAVHHEGERLAGRYFSFHSDTMDVPPQATVLAVSDRYVQAWTSGSVLAIQFHPDLDHNGIETLLGFEGPKLESFGVDVDGLRRELHATETLPGEHLIVGWLRSLDVVPDPVCS